MSNLVFHLTTSIESDLISCLDHPDSHFSKPPPVGPTAALTRTRLTYGRKAVIILYARGTLKTLL